MLRRKRLRAVSPKRMAVISDYAAFLLGMKDLVGYCCEACGLRNRPLDAHHTRKPRAEFLTDPESVIMLCRRCHERAEWPYERGRLVIHGTRRTGWTIRIVWAPDKFSLRAAEVMD